ncbi:MAG: pyridoxal 5'-phosphate synthase glutaminase subunit PdxT [Candidatus Eisenbacteria bacterium]|uniref:Pyridoxal 5'-phosphate synthase subunit PdxT n=1 Tax=Eiseniibacteriota bacterium TaxID=2212470 RepID=A0A9D6L7H5_UNCEI|nr:pyridoxal 5'-phosphate synthase glutaminase subunit PdxT [Candidatus Eisenbacteria bacterium]MBI3540343.1 pyridoxal 5'-phosphate synthase glutaminase subunit PdxT [Candidatus Eisenbacteria bacterium]
MRESAKPALAAPRVGVLALQGDFACHRASFAALGCDVGRVTLPADLEGLDALAMPGGESTTMLRLLVANRLYDPLAEFVRTKPVLATCAGVILLAREADLLPAPSFGVLDIGVDRNAYGRQIDSFHADLDAPVVGGTFHGVFIRAPRIRRVGAGVDIVARRTRTPADGAAAGEIVGVRAGRIVGLCFHPELTSDLRFHRWFLTEVAGLRLPAVESAVAVRRGAR